MAPFKISILGKIIKKNNANPIVFNISIKIIWIQFLGAGKSKFLNMQINNESKKPIVSGIEKHNTKHHIQSTCSSIDMLVDILFCSLNGKSAKINLTKI